MNADDYLDEINQLALESGRSNDIAQFIVGYTTGWLTPQQRASVVETAQWIYGQKEGS